MSRHEILEYDRNNSEFLLGFLKVKKKKSHMTEFNEFELRL